MGLRIRAACAVIALVALAACAARAARVDPAALVRAHDLVRQGCYGCLLAARETYEGMAAADRADAVALRLFEVHLLIALREKELGVDSSGSLDRARALLPRLHPQAARYLELVAAVPPDEAGAPKKVLGEYLTTLLREEFRPPALGWVRQGVLEPLVREYVAVAVECGRAVLTGRDAPESAIDAPILTYRRAICPATPDATALESLRDTPSGYGDAALFLARAALVSREGAAASVTSKTSAAARAYLEEAAASFPRSASIAYELGRVAQIEGDLRRAAGQYSRALDLQPDHEDARLGRAMALSYLTQPDAAVADATVLIDSGAYNRGEAFYWRAFNRHRAKDLEAARADIEQAKRLALSSRVLTLAGMIERDQGELSAAVLDLTQAVALDGANCAARWYLGVVRHAGEEWLESGVAFGGAARCYDAAALRSERGRDEMAARTDVDEEFRARQLEGFEAAIKEDRSQESAAALNAAIGYALGGDRGTADKYLDQAAKDPERRMAVADLRQVLKAP